MTSQKDPQDIQLIDTDTIDTDKFDRQKRIQGWDQNKIVNAKVMVIGVGATGNEVVKNLVLSGIGTLYIIDFDFIERSNLNRCVLFNSKAAENNEYKVDVVKEACKILNPDVKVIAIKKDLNTIDKKLYKECDVICSCLDNIEARLEANNYEYFGSVQAVYSKVQSAACLQCGITDKDLDLMWSKFSCTGQEIKAEDRESTKKLATIITTTSIIGGIQTQQVLKFLLDGDYFKENGKWSRQIGEPLIGKQLLYNGLKNRFIIIEKLKDPNCWTCSYQKPVN
jgi:molybdopterin/thiamine biosynthesis adenylyltransferase